MAATEPPQDEERQKQLFLKASKIFFLITVLYCLWIAIVIIGVYFLKLGNKWAILTIDQWILSAIALISIAIGLEIVLLLHFLLSRRKLLPPKKQTQKEYLQGKEVHSFTIPIDAKGGIFSKTYILIDENRVLNLRYQMIPPTELWRHPQ
jgi:hypothetical protein